MIRFVRDRCNILSGGVGMPVVRGEQLHRLGLAIFEGVGVPHSDAQRVMDLLVESNLVGHDSHGVTRIPVYVENILKGRLKPKLQMSVVKESATTAVVDGNWGLGQTVATRTMKMAISKAEQHDVGIVTAFNCGHIGRMADYALMAVEHDMVGYCAVNSFPQVVPFGGRERLFNQSPLSWAVPAGEEPPFVLDISTSVSAGGKIAVAHAKGERLPEGYIVDKDGRPTTDTKDYFEGGASLPMGGTVGYKGTGLAMAVDITAGLLSGRGAAYLGDRGQGVFQMAIKIDAFREVDRFKEEMDALIRKVRNSKPAPGFREVLVPGDIERRTKEIRSQNGIDVPENTWKVIVETAKKVKVDPSQYVC